MVATSTPEMQRMKLDRENRQRKKSNSAVSLKRLQKQKHVARDESSDDDDVVMIMADSEDDELEESEDESLDPIYLGGVDPNALQVGSYVLVEFKTEKAANPIFYVAQVEEKSNEDEEVMVNFLRKTSKFNNKFVHPQVPDSHPVSPLDIKAILPNSSSKGTTLRTKDSIIFAVKFGDLDIR